MVRYIPTTDGQCVLDADAPAARLLSIPNAEIVLFGFRKHAWDSAAEGSSYVANCFNAWANNLCDALTSAAELRAADAKQSEAA